MKKDICIYCGKFKPGNISTNGICEKCGWERMKESARQIKAKSGPIYEKWKARLRASVE